MNARQFAYDKHFGQTRADGSPYFGHVERVHDELAHLPGTTSSMLNACYLHDVQEDCEVLNSEIEALFGEETARFIEELTSPTAGSRREKTLLVLDKLSKASDEARIIKMVDRLDNIRGATSSGRGPRWVAKYLDETYALRTFVFTMPNKYKAAQDKLLTLLQDEIERVEAWLVLQR